MRNAGLADLCWLGAPKTWPLYRDYYQTRKPGAAAHTVDFNLVNGMGADYGQFGYFEPSTAYLRHSSIDAVSQTR
jgi:hypothetical protein